MLTSLYLLLLPVQAAPVDLDAALQQHAALSSRPFPALSAGDQQKLEAGQIVKLRVGGGQGEAIGAVGLVLTDLSRDAVWLGSLDPHTKPPGDMRMLALPRVGGELYRWYGFVDLPPPFDDRHFLIQTTIDERLAQTSNGAVWERSWALEQGWTATARGLLDGGLLAGVDAGKFNAAVPTPVNQGTWTVLDLDDGRSLVAYQVATTLGGDIPDGPLNRYLYWTLDGMLKDVVSAAREIGAHYVVGHPPLVGGDGRMLPTY